MRRTLTSRVTSVLPVSLRYYIVVVLWLSVLAAQLLVVAVAFDVLFVAFLDTCDMNHESANTLVGWSVASISIFFTALIGVGFHRSFGLSRVVVVIGVVALVLIFALLLLASGGQCR